MANQEGTQQDAEIIRPKGKGNQSGIRNRLVCDDDRDSEVTFNFRRANANTAPVSIAASRQGSSFENDLEKLSGDPAFERYISKIVAQQMQKQQTTEDGTAGMCNTPSVRAHKSNVIAMKSPSDTTIYAPALAKSPVRMEPLLVPTNFSIGGENQMQPNSNSVIIENQISDFVEQVRIADRQDAQEDASPGTSGSKAGGGDRELTRNDRAGKFTLQAEKFRASVNAPKGIEANEFYEHLKDDDDFFHITAHVDPATVLKIQKGEFIDLEKLLPRPKGIFNEQPKTRFFFQDGHPYFAPQVDRSRMITSFRKWENAFRVYAAIYSQANPDRAGEIWQYVFVINTAANAYVWPNVAEYDYAFRQMMGENPRRSWAKTYTQMWNVCLTEHLQSRPGYNTFGGGKTWGNNPSSASHGPHQNNSGQNGPNKSPAANGGGKSTHCWRFNRTGKCKFGKDCKYINRCSYCDGVSHGLYNCPKKAEVVNAVVNAQQ